jgi:hypothetical protein
MKFNRLLLGLILTGVVSYISCRKIDRQPDKPINANPQSKFFNSHRSSDPLETALVNFIKRENDKSPFIDKVIKQIGYPYWDKGMTVSKQHVRGRSASDSSIIVYIPFVRDSQNYVNASMAISVAPGDTSFKYLCDWQYASMTFSTGSIADTSAEKTALLFMALGRNIFGYSTYDISDKRLFHNSSNYTDTARIRRHVTIEPVQSSNKSSTLASICYTTTVWTITVNWHCVGCVGACDMCTAMCVDYSVSNHTEVNCFDEEVGGSQTGGGTSGGGGSGTGGGTTPPECSGPVAARNETGTNPPCVPPGWNPPPPPPPCDPYISSLAADTAFKNKFIYLNHNDRTGGTKEHGFAVFDRAAGNYQLKIGQNHVPHIPWNDVILPGMKVDGILHNHFLNYNNIFSPDDILQMAELYIKGYVKDTINFFMGMTSNTDAPYLIKVSNPVKFRQFANKILALEEKNNSFSRDYNNKLNSGDNTKNLKAFFEMLQKHGGLAGLSVYEAVPDGSSNYNFDQWKKLNWDGNGDFNPATNCN